MRTCLRSRPITLQIPRRSVETRTKPGPHRWVVCRAFPRPAGRLPPPTLRYERPARLFTAFLTLAATLTCYKKQTT